LANRRWISSGLILLTLLLTGAGVVLLVKTDQEGGARIQEPVRRVKVEVFRLSLRPYIRWVEVFATVVPSRKGSVSAEVAGTLMHLGSHTEPGQPVKAGQELARLDQTRFRLSLQKAKAALRKLKALLEIERNENQRRAALFRIAKERLTLAESDYQRNLELFRKNLIAKQTLETAQNLVEIQRSEFERARSELKNRQARIRSILADIASAKAEIARLEEDLADTVVRAPFDGLIGQRLIEMGDHVSRGQTLFTVIDISWVKVIAQIPSEHIANIPVGREVEITTSSLPEIVFRGRVAHRYPEADPKNRTFSIEILVENEKEPFLLPGMFARVRIPVFQMEKALLVPRDALLEDDRGTYIYVVDEAREAVERRYITVASLDPEEALISKGISPGELIVIQGQRLLHPGAPVQWISSAPHKGPGSQSADSES